ncbi:serine/threonine-protein kinase [Streptomyces sp. NPDC052000]|uniref:serine/threonine-protein kinase n=1 Tax=Streptomyces sp. NPDC052000 TaxID=3155676 RepID=UPI00344CCEB6
METGVDLPGHIGTYVVERELGAGGMGTVYLARSRGGRPVAVKVARPELAADPSFRARFRAEVEAARQVGGFHTAPVVDADPDAAAPWLATAYIPGPTLSGLLDEQGPMGEPQLRLLGAALAEALQAIHGCGLIHRDLKPGNIIMAEDGPRVLDFGIARAVESTRLTSTGTAFGTPGFLSPEQARGLEVGPAADVFALGAVLVAAAGGKAFGEGEAMGLMYRAVHDPPDLSAVPPGMRPVVADCLAKNPAQRPVPAQLLDLLAPKPPPQRTAVAGAGAGAGSGAGAAVGPAPMPTPTPPPTPLPTPTPTVVVGHGTSAETVEDAPTTAPPRRARTALLAAGVAGALLLTGGGLYAAGTFTGKEDDSPLPPATHELTTPIKVAGGGYVRDRETWKQEPNGKSVIAHYAGISKKPEFREFSITGSSGRFKHLGEERDRLMRSLTHTGKEQVTDPRRDLHVPGSEITYSCETVTDATVYTVCVWADTNTIAGIKFTPSAARLEAAAAETQKIRKDMRTPITTHP